MAGINIGSNIPFYSPTTGKSGTAEQHAQWVKEKREAEDKAKQQENFQTNQTQQYQNTVNQGAAGYASGAPSAGAAGAAARNAAATRSLTGAGFTVDPTGLVNFNDTGEQARLTAKTNAQLEAEAEARRLATLKSLMATYGKAGREAAPPREGHRGLSIDGSEEAARAAAFARAKDQTGQITRGAVDSLRNLYAGTGNVGAGRQGLENIVAGGMANLNEFTRDQLMADLAREAEVSDLTYQGGITQRGQDINRPFDPQLQALISLMGTIY